MKLKFVSFVFALVSFLSLFAGCGVDNFIYLYPVTQILNSPSSDPVKNYYSFRTTDDLNDSDYFKGFEVYYRIYSSSTLKNQDASDINTYNTNNPTTVVNYLLTTKHYARMTSSGRIGKYPLVPENKPSDRDVLVRLIDNGTDSSGAANLNIGGSNNGIPLRTINEGTATDSFIFTSIDVGESDVSSTGWDDTANHKWYVLSYVFAYGFDEAYKPIYSSIACLGTITIPE